MSIPQRFGEGPPPLTIGIEEELAICDARTLEQVGRVDAILGGLDGRRLPGRAKTELHASVFELNTEPCATAGEALEALVELRRAAAEAAASAGLAVAATGSHPLAVSEEQPIVQEERYLAMVAHHGVSALHQDVQGLHVHLAMPSGEDCWRVLEGLLPWLPVVLAVSANSPWVAGRLTGMASNRAPALAELPRTGAPPPLGSYAAWEAWVEELVALGVIDDYTWIWWDVRPHPGLGTLEVRVPDQPTDVRRSAAIAAALQALAGRLLLAGEVAVADRGHYEQNRWAAARFGPAAELVVPGGGRLATAAELAREGLGLDLDGSEAELQARFGDPREAVADLVARSVA
ncbi:MAG TPA: YbdK family carboxylate-amine ligase [Gaiellaceae bacterium]|nr:YbdK family carboxylate-amine ligase [Gaiellaceae bacterium]